MSRHRILLLVAASLSATLWAYGCGDGTTEPPTPPPDPPRPATVMVTPATAQLGALGATVQLTAEVRDQNGQAMASAAVTWASGSAAVATVSGSGLVTAAGNGTATITARAGAVSGSAAVTVAQEVSTVVVSPAEATLVQGDTLRLAAAATDANGHVVLGVEFAWMSSDTLVAVVDAAGLVTGIGSGEAEVTATAAGRAGRLDLTVFVGQPPGVAYGKVVLPGTVWAAADVITAADPSALDSVVYVGRGMRRFFDPLEGGWRDLEVFLLEAHFAGGTILEVQAHPAYVEADSALAAAKLFLPPIGRLPRVLIDGAREVELIPTGPRPPDFGAGGNSCGNLYHWEGDLRRAVRRIPPQGRPQAHYVEEAALHEGSHAVLEDCPWDGCHDSACDVGLGNPTSAEWRAAQAADSVFITLYALEHQEREDMAETLWAWFVSRCVPDRLHPEYKRRIDAGIPHRLAYLDGRLLGLDLRPWQCSGAG